MMFIITMKIRLFLDKYFLDIKLSITNGSLEFGSCDIEIV